MLVSHLIQEESKTASYMLPTCPAADPGWWLLFKSTAEVSMHL